MLKLCKLYFKLSELRSLYQNVTRSWKTSQNAFSIKIVFFPLLGSQMHQDHVQEIREQWDKYFYCYNIKRYTHY